MKKDLWAVLDDINDDLGDSDFEAQLNKAEY